MLGMQLTASGQFVDHLQVHLRHQSPDAIPTGAQQKVDRDNRISSHCWLMLSSGDPV
jgi:hypothetical protein